ncbi:hypothetical protein [Pseudaestuariivita rosea]|uniref:hypothetical protein n=1 Tax=Pseudaestuariivita rosea TaxID=2763263 RepID=UPI001ABBD836|nr:hypothetical protein [Pseudaestuariivita rosea]
MALLRVIFIGFIFLTIVYVVLSLYSRSVRRSKLAREWDQEVRIGDRDAFIREGMEDYDNSFRKKLLWGVYIVPVVLMITIIYITNFVN